MAASRNITTPAHGNTIADDQALVSQNIAKMMLATADAASADDQSAASEVKATTIPALFTRWKEQDDLASDVNLPDDVAQTHSDAAAEIEKLIVEAQPVTAQDFAMKLLATTHYGDFHPDDTLIAEAKALAGDVSACVMSKSPGHIPHATRGVLDPLVDTGRGSWVFFSKTTLEELLERYDRAYPEFTDCSREEVIQSWRGAEQWIRDTEALVQAQETAV